MVLVLDFQLLQFAKFQILDKGCQVLFFPRQAIAVHIFQGPVSPKISDEHKMLIPQLNVIRNFCFAFNFDDIHGIVVSCQLSVVGICSISLN
jgi:hypothetical protein